MIYLQRCQGSLVILPHLRVGSKGFVVNRGALHPEIHSVAVPVRDAQGFVCRALSAGGIRAVFTGERLAEIAVDLVRLSARLAPAVGHEPGDAKPA